MCFNEMTKKLLIMEKEGKKICLAVAVSLISGIQIPPETRQLLEI